MTKVDGSLTITIHRDGQLSSSVYRIPVLLLRATIVGLVVLLLLAILGLAVYGPVGRAAARVPGLERKVARLEVDNKRIADLAVALAEMEASYARLRQMVGADITPDPVRMASTLPLAPAITVLPVANRVRYELGASLPKHWPLDARGYVTRGQVPVDPVDGAHPGIDVAIPVGSLVRAAGGGMVLRAGLDEEYGQFVLLEHPEGYQSMYGHLSRVVVRDSQRIAAGDVIARSGNTGRSSAPHLHFEIRLNGASTDPMALVDQGSAR